MLCRRIRALWLAVTFAAAPSLAQQPAAAPALAKHPFTEEDALALRLVSDPRVSPDGESVLYAVSTADLAANARRVTTYVITGAAAAPRAFPDDAAHASEARWSDRMTAYDGG